MTEFNQLEFIKKVYPLHRTLVSDDIDLTLEIIQNSLPQDFKKYYSITEVASGTQCWTWKTPQKYTVKEAYIETIEGERIVDFEDNNLHLVSYSQKVDSILPYDELVPYLHYNTKRPNAIPWKFYYYVNNWGFCLSYNQFKSLNKNTKYKVVINCEFEDDYLKIGELVIPGKSEKELLIVANICHPYQVNDSITGVSAVLQSLYNLVGCEFDKSIRVLFLPETIGSVCYFSKNEQLKDIIEYGIFTEMLGNNDSLALQYSFQENTYIDTLAETIMKQSDKKYRTGAFRTIVGNDELVINGPGLNIPTISISRSKVTLDSYPEYHTSDDNPSMLIESNLEEAATLLTNIIKVYIQDYIPVRTFKGPVFLSGYNLWGIWGDIKDGKEYVDRIMYHLEGELSVFEISQLTPFGYNKTKHILDVFLEKGLITKQL